ncbi:MAG: hypothetical protein WD768_23350 [Phycisphaeraceae bacterium]
MPTLPELLSRTHSAEVIGSRFSQIRQAMLRESKHITAPNFDVVHPDDVARLFRLYDRGYFDGQLESAAIDRSGNPLRFRLSSRATRAGGKTITYRRPQPKGIEYEIVIASRLLFLTFDEIERSVIVCGHPCHDRLEAMQRIMEHEMVHLAELVVWSKSSCRAERFQGMARRLFGHTGFNHDLVTPGESAAVKFNLQVGRMVSFEMDGRVLTGRINRIQSRATVLVEDSAGVKYTDGKRYQKYYVPLPMLRREA